MEKQTIKDFSGRIIGTIETDASGNKTVKAFSGKILGYYKKNIDATTNFTGKIIARGDATGMLFNM